MKITQSYCNNNIDNNSNNNKDNKHKNKLSIQKKEGPENESGQTQSEEDTSFLNNEKWGTKQKK